MKRAAGLRRLSEDHHHGLVHARRLRRAASSAEGSDQLGAARGFLEFWRAETSGHFREEEEVLLPVYARYGGDLGREPIRKMHAQHAWLRGLVMRLGDEVGAGTVRPGTLREIGERLDEHIRLEERELFPMVEESLPAEALDEVGARIEAEEADPRAGR